MSDKYRGVDRAELEEHFGAPVPAAPQPETGEKRADDIEVAAWLIANRYCCSCPEDYYDGGDELTHLPRCGAPIAVSEIETMLRSRLRSRPVVEAPALSEEERAVVVKWIGYAESNADEFKRVGNEASREKQLAVAKALRLALSASPSAEPAPDDPCPPRAERDTRISHAVTMLMAGRDATKLRDPYVAIDAHVADRLAPSAERPTKHPDVCPTCGAWPPDTHTYCSNGWHNGRERICRPSAEPRLPPMPDGVCTACTAVLLPAWNYCALCGKDRRPDPGALAWLDKQLAPSAERCPLCGALARIGTDELGAERYECTRDGCVGNYYTRTQSLAHSYLLAKRDGRIAPSAERVEQALRSWAMEKHGEPETWHLMLRDYLADDDIEHLARHIASEIEK